MTLLASGSVLAEKPEAASKSAPKDRQVWAGIEAGPLAPKAALALEARMIEALSERGEARIVDAKGSGLTEPALDASALEVESRIRRGIELLLDLQHLPAIRELDAAIELFEAHARRGSDFALLEKALLSKARSLEENKKAEAARTVLKTLGALEPTRPPTVSTDRPRLVELYNKSLAELGDRGLFEISIDEPGATIQVDGRPLPPGATSSPLLLPGRHQLSARWVNRVVQQGVQLGAGQRLPVKISREGPAENARRELLQVLQFRRGPEAVGIAVDKLLHFAEARSVLAGTLRKSESETLLYLARLGPRGAIEALYSVPISQETISDRAKTSLAEALSKNSLETELRFGTDGVARTGTGLSTLFFGRRSASADEPPPPKNRPNPQPETAP